MLCKKEDGMNNQNDLAHLLQLDLNMVMNFELCWLGRWTLKNELVATFLECWFIHVRSYATSSIIFVSCILLYTTFKVCFNRVFLGTPSSTKFLVESNAWRTSHPLVFLDIHLLSKIVWVASVFEILNRSIWFFLQNKDDNFLQTRNHFLRVVSKYIS